MVTPEVSPTTLQIRRTLPARRERVFGAWLEPAALQRWFVAGEGYSVPLAEVDARVGGRYRLGVKTPQGDVFYVGGEYQEIRPPERLVFTWRWESPDPQEPTTLVTVELFERGQQTEIVLTHARHPDAARRDQHRLGWESCLDGLERLLAQTEA